MDLISEGYLAQMRAMHERPEGFGGKGARWAPAVFDIARQLAAGPVPVRGILDYGTGQGTLPSALAARGMNVRGYDPAVVEFSAEPIPADIVVCTDVLEHVEPACLGDVLFHLQVLTLQVLFVVVALEPCGKTLPDGRNAHINLKTAGEWHREFNGRFRPAEPALQRLVSPVGEKHYASIWRADT